jgi:hypothetical protein
MRQHMLLLLLNLGRYDGPRILMEFLKSFGIEPIEKLSF